MALRLGAEELGLTRVCVAEDAIVDDLREAIKAKFTQRLGRVDAAELTLFDGDAKVPAYQAVSRLEQGRTGEHPLIVNVPVVAPGACPHHGAPRARPLSLLACYPAGTNPGSSVGVPHLPARHLARCACVVFAHQPIHPFFSPCILAGRACCHAPTTLVAGEWFAPTMCGVSVGCSSAPFPS